MNRNGFIIALFALVALTSCKDTLEPKRTLAGALALQLMATDSKVEMVQDPSNPEKMMTVLTYTGCSADLTDAEMERRANSVAADYINGLGVNDTSEEHLKMLCETTTDLRYEYLFNISELREVKVYDDTARAMLSSIIAGDTVAIAAGIDAHFISAADVHAIYMENVSDHTKYAGEFPQTEFLGYRLTASKEDPSQHVFTTNYTVSNESYITYYTINVDCRTKKVVQIWMKTDAKQ